MDKGGCVRRGKGSDGIVVSIQTKEMYELSQHTPNQNREETSPKTFELVLSELVLINILAFVLLNE